MTAINTCGKKKFLTPQLILLQHFNVSRYVCDFCRFQNLLTSLCPSGVTTITLWATSCHTRQPKPCTKRTTWNSSSHIYLYIHKNSKVQGEPKSEMAKTFSNACNMQRNFIMFYSNERSRHFSNMLPFYCTSVIACQCNSNSSKLYLWVGFYRIW